MVNLFEELLINRFVFSLRCSLQFSSRYGDTIVFVVAFNDWAKLKWYHRLNFTPHDALHLVPIILAQGIRKKKILKTQGTLIWLSFLFAHSFCELMEICVKTWCLEAIFHFISIQDAVASNLNVCSQIGAHVLAIIWRFFLYKKINNEKNLYSVWLRFTSRNYRPKFEATSDQVLFSSVLQGSLLAYHSIFSLKIQSDWYQNKILTVVLKHHIKLNVFP